ncbi:hypothetical protein Hanom_Chr16g01464751 [Helianthus anomalus]
MVSIRHFEFACRSHGQQPTVDRFRVFDNLQSNLGFFSLTMHGVAKKLLINSPKSYHDCNGNFFYIREEVIPIAMEFRVPGPILKENIVVPKVVDWYEGLKALPNQAFGEQVLVAAGMSDKWPRTSKNVPVLLLDGTFMGVWPLCDDEELWYEKIRVNLMYLTADAFAEPPTATKGAHILNPRACRAKTPAGEEYSSEFNVSNCDESIASLEHELNIPSFVFAGILGIDSEGQKPKRPSKKKNVTVAKGARAKKLEATAVASNAASRKGTARPPQHSLNDYVIIPDSMEELHSIGGKFKGVGMTSTRSSGSVSSRDQPSGASPTSTPAEEDVEANPSQELTWKKHFKAPV